MKSFILKITTIVFVGIVLFPLETLEARRVKDIEAKTSLQNTLCAIGYEKEAEEIVSLIKEVFPNLEELKKLPVEERIERLALMIKEKIKTYEQGTFELTAVLREKKANCFGYSQLFYLLGKEVGLDVEVILVSSEHVANLIKLDKGFMLLDLSTERVSYSASRVFDWDKTYQREASIWHLKEISPLLEFFRIVRILILGKVQIPPFYEVIQRLDERGILAIMYSHYGCSKGELGLYQEEIEDYTKAIELNPDYYLAYYNRGVVLTKLGLYRAAIADFTKAVELNPYFVDAYCSCGTVRYMLGQFKEAINDFNRAIELEPDNAVAYYNRGRIFEELGFMLEALNDYTKAIELKPDYVLAYLGRGVIRYLYLNQKEEALADFREVLRLKPELYEQFPKEILELLEK